MRYSPKRLKWWLVIGLFSMLLAACSTAVSDEAGQAKPAAGSVAEAAEEESLTPTEEGVSSADVELETAVPADPDTAGEADDPENSEVEASGDDSGDQPAEEHGEPADEATSESETASAEEDESETAKETHIQQEKAP